MPEQPGHHVHARIPSHHEHMDRTVPDWCDLVLEIGMSGHGSSIYVHKLTRRAGEDIIAALHKTLHPHAGRSAIEQLWEELDATVDRLMGGGGAADDKGRAQGLTWAIAVLRNPYEPNYEAVREEAAERWEAASKES